MIVFLLKSPKIVVISIVLKSFCFCSSLEGGYRWVTKFIKNKTNSKKLWSPPLIPPQGGKINLLNKKS